MLLPRPLIIYLKSLDAFLSLVCLNLVQCKLQVVQKRLFNIQFAFVLKGQFGTQCFLNIHYLINYVHKQTTLKMLNFDFKYMHNLIGEMCCKIIFLEYMNILHVV